MRLSVGLFLIFRFYSILLIGAFILFFPFLLIWGFDAFSSLKQWFWGSGSLFFTRFCFLESGQMMGFSLLSSLSGRLQSRFLFISFLFLDLGFLKCISFLGMGRVSSFWCVIFWEFDFSDLHVMQAIKFEPFSLISLKKGFFFCHFVFDLIDL